MGQAEQCSYGPVIVIPEMFYSRKRIGLILSEQKLTFTSNNGNRLYSPVCRPQLLQRQIWTPPNCHGWNPILWTFCIVQ